MITQLHWFVVHTRIDGADVPIAAFDNEDAAKCYGADMRDSVMQRPIFIGDVESKSLRLLRDIVKPDRTVEDEERMFKAIEDAKKMFGYD